MERDDRLDLRLKHVHALRDLPPTFDRISIILSESTRRFRSSRGVCAAVRL